MIGKLRLNQLIASALAALLLAAPASARSDESTPVVTAAVQVTDDPDPVRAHSSPQIVRNRDNGELVIGETEVYHDFGINVRLSVDDGRSWFRGGDPMMEPFTWRPTTPSTARTSRWPSTGRTGCTWPSRPPSPGSPA